MDVLVAKTKGFPYEEEPKETTWGDELKSHHYYVQSAKRANQAYADIMKLQPDEKKQKVDEAYEKAKQLVNKSGFTVFATTSSTPQP